jgi:TonB family protein
MFVVRVRRLMSMRIRAMFVCAAFLTGMLAASFSQNTAQNSPQNPAPNNTQDPQKRAETMLQRARALSDIRSANAPAFHLKATFSFIGGDLEAAEGTYNEVWVSDSKWRTEITVGGLQRTEVGGPEKLWRIDKGNLLPEKALQMPSILRMLPAPSARLEFETISSQMEATFPMECALTKAGARKERTAFCFEDKSGVLVEKILPLSRSRNMVAYSCEYGGFKKFAHYSFPRDIVCYEDQHTSISVKIVDLVLEPLPDAALFAPPAGALELGNCFGEMKPPVPKPAPAPEVPFGYRNEARPGLVTLSVIVDTKGKPQDVKVLHPADKNFDNSALSAVRGWRFKPATCDGVPMQVQINVQIDYWVYHPI